MNIILVDSGTTNSRIRLTTLNNKKILDSYKVKVGVRNSAIEGSNLKLKKELKKGISVIIKKNNMRPQDISYIIASGMITSNLGLYEVPHITSPSSVPDFVSNAVMKKEEYLYNIPILYIPGMKNNVNLKENILENINEYDIMRGEEVETIGLLEQIDVTGDGIIILPGSHTKYIFIDKNKNLTSCLSTLAGETLLSLQKETILSESLSQELIEEVETKYLRAGYDASEKYGVTRGLYHVRLLDNYSNLNKNQLANYFTGAILYNDIKVLIESLEDVEKIKWTIIGGSSPLRDVFYHLINNLSTGWDVIKANNNQVENSTVYGSKKILSKYLNMEGL